MRIKIFFERDSKQKSLEIPKGQTIESLLKKLRINPQTVIVVKNGEVVPEQETLQEKDTLKILSVKLGG
jgi:thiamine biosynthesis protein ThiS